MDDPAGAAARVTVAEPSGDGLEDSVYKAIFDNASAALLLADDQRRYVAANDAACLLLGMARERLLTLRIDDVMARSAAPEATDAMWAEFLRAGQQVAELELHDASGAARVVSFTARANVLPGLHLSVLFDITAQRAAEQRTHAEREQLYAASLRARERVTRLQAATASLARARTVVEVASAIVDEGCAAFDARRGVVGLLVEAGSNVELVGVRSDAYEQAAPGFTFPSDQPTPIREAIASLELRLYDAAELKARFPELYQRYFTRHELLVALPLSLHKQALGALTLAYPASRAFSEEDRRDLLAFARLCAWAIERAKLFDLAQTERRRAEEANRVKDDFLAVVSHELRTPLHAMLGWATLARSGKLEGEGLERALKTIERNAHAQAKLVEDLLDITRIHSGKLRLHVEPTDAARVVEAALDVVRPAADARGVALAFEAPAAELVMAADPDRLQQIVWNLLSNAVKFSERGGEVRVTLTRELEHIALTVEDHGRGIEPSFLPHIYERFRQAETSKRGRAGLGLGLAIVRNLVELHGGTIDARSEGLGQGAVFTVALPSWSAEATRIVDASRVDVH